MGKELKTVDELVNMIERGELRLPEMQRRYVWPSTRVRDLFDSLYRGYPSGTILLWETDDEVPTQEMALNQKDGSYKLLLDGQQRLTSLAAVIKGKPVTVRDNQKPIELLFNLEHPDGPSFFTEVREEDRNSENEEDRADDETDSTEDELLKRFNRMTFVVATKKLASLPQWVNVNDVFKTDSDKNFLKRAGVKDFNDPNFDRYSNRLKRLRAIRKYSYRIDVLERSLSYEEVVEIFVRVNSLGTQLRGSDLALAQITAKWRNSLKEFQKFQQDCKKKGFDLDLGSVHLRNLIAFATNQSRFRTIGSLSIENLKTGWKNSCDGMNFSLNFMKENVNLDSPALLASPYILIAIAYFGYRKNYSLSPDEEKDLRRWVLLANSKGHYSRGSSETFLDQDLDILNSNGGTSELTEHLKRQVGNLRITEEELKGRTQRSALFKTMFLAFRADGAKDWLSNLAIAINHSGTQHKLQFHHIFPRAVLKDKYTSREINDIANLCFISAKTNKWIGKKPPSVYFPEIIKTSGTKPLDVQCVPMKEKFFDKFFDPEEYKQFLAKRRELIARRLNEFLHEA